ncbi:MAG: hypothetical protein KGZ39_00390 [Simkania sp.]|nr:hypothetical protein [Simkania sp.]
MKSEIRFYVDATSYIPYFVDAEKKELSLNNIKNAIQHPEYGRTLSLEINQLNTRFILLPIASIKFISIVDHEEDQSAVSDTEPQVQS